jgi:phage FluMu protein Com
MPILNAASTRRLIDVRCPTCRALLLRASADSTVEIRCRRCRTLFTRSGSSERPERPATGDADVPTQEPLS